MPISSSSVGRSGLNLLSNAFKYNREAGHVTITLDGADDQVRIAISDSGFGIAPDDMQRLFVPFERLRSGASNVQGTGLGLSVSRHFVEAMGGHLEVFSDIGQGSTFSVVLPRTDPATQRKRPSDLVACCAAGLFGIGGLV